MLETARSSGLPNEHWNTLHKIVRHHIDAFCVAFSNGLLAHLPPLRIDTTAEALEVKCCLKNSPPGQRIFMTNVFSCLVAAGMAYLNTMAKWPSAPLILPKLGKAKFRFNVDLRANNRLEIPHNYSMPLLDCEFTKLSRSKFYTNFDLMHGYRHLLLHAVSKKYKLLMTPNRVYTPKRILYETTDAVTYSQPVLSVKIIHVLSKVLLQWLDIMLLYCKTVPDPLDAIQDLLLLWTRPSLRLHPGRCLLFATQVRWSGRLVDAIN